jgi:hypothetical protein
MQDHVVRDHHSIQTQSSNAMHGASMKERSTNPAHKVSFKLKGAFV